MDKNREFVVQPINENLKFYIYDTDSFIPQCHILKINENEEISVRLDKPEYLSEIKFTDLEKEIFINFIKSKIDGIIVWNWAAGAWNGYVQNNNKMSFLGRREAPDYSLLGKSFNEEENENKNYRSIPINFDDDGIEIDLSPRGIFNIYNNESSTPHFHITNLGENLDKEVCIRLDKPEYFYYDPKQSKLNNFEKELFLEFIKSKDEFGNIRWNWMKYTWNGYAHFNKNMNPISINEIPDYSLLETE